MMRKQFLSIGKALARIPFVRDVATLQMGGLFIMGIGFVRSIVVARLLGLEGFGAYSVIASFTGTVSIITSFGQNQAALTFFAESYEKKNRGDMRTIIRYYLLLSFIAIIVLSTLILLTPSMVRVLYDDPSMIRAAQIAFAAMIVGSLETLILMVLQTVREIRFLTLLENFNNLLQISMICLLLFFWRSPESVFLGLFLSNMIMLPFSLALFGKMRKKYAIPGLVESLRKGGAIGRYLRQGLWIAVDKNLGKLYPQGYLFILSLITSQANVGLANLAFKIGSLPGSVFLPHVSRMVMTVLPAIRSKGNMALRQACAQLIKHALAAQAVIVFASVGLLPPLLIFVYGWEYSAAVIPVVWIALLQIISPLKIANSPLYRLFYKAHIPAVWNMIILPLEFLLLALLVHIMNPLHAFVLIIAIDMFSGLWLSWYAYNILLKKKS